MKNVLIYIGVFLLTLYCYFLYDDKIVTMMLVMEVFYFVISVLWLQYIKNKIDVSMNPLIPIAEKKQNISVKFVIQNRMKFFSVPVKILVVVENVFTGQKRKIKKAITAAANKKEEFVVDLKANSCGNISISLKSYWIGDFFSIFNKKRISKEVQYVGILPECHLIPIEVTRRTREFIADADEYFDRERGEDTSEIYQIREYRDMDSMRDIHWKLSAKADELLIKEHGKPKGCVVLIWLNIQSEMKHKKNINTVILEAVASLSISMLEEDCVHMVAWYEKENRKIQKKRISKEEHVYELLNRLLYIKAYEEDVNEQYEEAFRGVSFSSIIEIKADGSISINDEEKIKLSFEEGKNKWDTFYFIV